MFVETDDPFQRAVLADCRGDGNIDARIGCVVDWGSVRCLTEGTFLRAVAPSRDDRAPLRSRLSVHSRPHH